MGSEARFQVINGIVGGQCTFYPGYIKASGEFVSPHLTVPMYVNHDNYGMGGGNLAINDPKRKPSSLFELTLWGDKPCAVGAHWFTSGKRLTIRGRMESKKLAVKDNQNNMPLQLSTGLEVDPATGAKFQRGMQIPIYRWRYSFTIERFHFGEDSAEANRRKPVGWNVEGTVGYQQWQEYIRNMQASQAAGYNGGDTFGLSKLGRVSGQLARKDATTGQIIPIGTAVSMGAPIAQPGIPVAQPGVINNPAMFNAGGAVDPNAPPNMGMPVTTMAPPAGTFVQPGAPVAQPGQPGYVAPPVVAGAPVAFSPGMYAGM
jgi:hypothetical protein